MKMHSNTKLYKRDCIPMEKPKAMLDIAEVLSTLIFLIAISAGVIYFVEEIHAFLMKVAARGALW